MGYMYEKGLVRSGGSAQGEYGKSNFLISRRYRKGSRILPEKCSSWLVRSYDWSWLHLRERLDWQKEQRPGKKILRVGARKAQSKSDVQFSNDVPLERHSREFRSFKRQACLRFTCHCKRTRLHQSSYKSRYLLQPWHLCSEGCYDSQRSLQEGLW